MTPDPIFLTILGCHYVDIANGAVPNFFDPDPDGDGDDFYAEFVYECVGYAENARDLFGILGNPEYRAHVVHDRTGLTVAIWHDEDEDGPILLWENGEAAPVV